MCPLFHGDFFHFHGHNVGFSPFGFTVNFHRNKIFLTGWFKDFFAVGKFSRVVNRYFSRVTKNFSRKKTLGSTTGILYFGIVQ